MGAPPLEAEAEAVVAAEAGALPAAIPHVVAEGLPIIPPVAPVPAHALAPRFP